MPKVSPSQTSFVAGELSPTTHGRTDLEIYRQGMSTCLNYVPFKDGSLYRRSGTKYLSEINGSSKKVRLFVYRLSDTELHLMEWGDLYVRIYINGVINQTIATPYLEADLPGLSFAADKFTIYLAHGSYAPRFIITSASGLWSLFNFIPSSAVLYRGPWQDKKTDVAGHGLTPGATSGTTTLTATAASLVRWAPTDVGRWVRVLDTTWKVIEITGYTSGTVVNVTIHEALSGTATIGTYALGAWSATTGYPKFVTVHQNRIIYSCTATEPQRIDIGGAAKQPAVVNGLAVFQETYVFAPTDPDGTISQAHAFTVPLAGNEAIKWVVPYRDGLLAGTDETIWIIDSSGAYLHPTDFRANRAISFGSDAIPPADLGNSFLFIQNGGRKVRDFGYREEIRGYVAPEITVFWKHLMTQRISKIVVQRKPDTFVWAITPDGRLLGLTYDKEYSEGLYGWHRHTIGGVSDVGGSPAVVEDIAVLPSADGTREDVVLVVRRRINGGTKRYLEYITEFFEEEDVQRDAFFVDSGKTQDNPKTISGVTQASPVVVTSTAHGYSNGDKVLLTDFVGADELEGNFYLVASVTANTFALKDLDGVTDVNGTAFTPYVSGGKARKCVTSVTGLSHLEGQSVDILADGAVHEARTVSGGAITLDYAAAVVHVGLHYESDGQMLPINAGAADGTAQGKTRRTNRVSMQVRNTSGMKVGMDLTEELYEVIFREGDALLGVATPLFSGIVELPIEANYDFDNKICWRQDQPLPGTILAVLPQMTTQDR